MTRTEHFFHGTTHDVEPAPGSNVPRILPFSAAAKIHAEQGDEWAGHEKYPDLYHDQPWRREHVFSTSDESEAWSWAGGHGRQRVYQVEPEGHAEPGSFADDSIPGEKISRTARVLGVQFTPPADYARHFPKDSSNFRMEPHGGVQGTLHGHDWIGNPSGFDWAPFHDRKASAQSFLNQQSDERFDRANETVRNQERLNNRRRQRKLF